MLSLFNKTINNLKQDKSLMFAVLFIIVVLLLRLYKIDGYAIFLGDQGRDAIIIKRIVTFEHLTAIGAITSIGQIFLGPFYYYFIAPWLFLFNFNPLGLAVGVAITSACLLLVIYVSTAKLFSRHLAWFILITSGFATVLYDFSRFSWNPNLLPYIAFLISLAVYYVFKTKKNIGAVFLGALLSIAVQLHYIALILLPPVVFLFSFYLLFERKSIKTIARMIVIATISFLTVSLPLILFDLRHGFLNSKNFLKLFSQTDTVGQGKWDQLLAVFYSLNKFLFGQELNQAVLIFVLVIFLGALLFVISKERKYSLMGFFFMFIIIGLSLYSGPKYAHYLSVAYIYYLALIGVILLYFIPKKVTPMLIGIILAFFCVSSIMRYDFLNRGPNYQIRHAKRVAEAILPLIHTNAFQITSLPERYSDYTYRYFLEVLGHRPLEKDTLKKASELFVICEGRCDLIIGNPTWDIAFFAPRKIVKQTKTDGVTIYKLSR